MHLEHTFTIPGGVEQAWSTLLDLERIAPCLPGARIESVNDGTYHGAVDVKVGPIALTYRGTAEFTRTDRESHTAVLAARTREARGSGHANATITASLTDESDGSTRVDVATELDITGRPAQFGTDVLTEVGGRLLDQFASRLAVEMASTGRTGVEAGTTRPHATSNTDKRADLLTLVAVPLLKRAAVPVLVGASTALVVWRLGRRRNTTTTTT